MIKSWRGGVSGMTSSDELDAAGGDSGETSAGIDVSLGEVLEGMVRELRNNTHQHFDSSVVDASYFTVTGTEYSADVVDVTTTGVEFATLVKREPVVEDELKVVFSQDRVDGVRVVPNSSCVQYHERCVYAFIRDIDARHFVVGEYVPFTEQVLTVAGLRRELLAVVDDGDVFSVVFDAAVESARAEFDSDFC